MNRPLQRILLVVCCVLLWEGALGIRREVLSQQTRSLQGKEAPFLKESALQYRMTRMVNDQGGLPKLDRAVGVPQGVEPAKTYSVGAEWIYVAIARLLPDDFSLINRVRWASAAVFSLAIPFAFLWVWLTTRSVWGALVSAAVLMVSPAFAVRSSGLELSRENLAIPLFILFFVGEGRLRRAENRLQICWFAGVSAAVLVLAQCFWDLTQYVTGLWGLVRWGTFLFTGREARGEREQWWWVTAGMLLAGLANPYLRTHGFLFSPVCAMLLARSLIYAFPRSGVRRGWILGLGVMGGWILLGRLFVENYSHFGELLSAKLQFRNVKPEDPSVLTYIQRIMWTPALHSTTWALHAAYFPLLLWLGVPAAVRGVFKREEDSAGRAESFDGSWRAVGIYALVTLPVYVLFFRFHVFLVLFMAVSLGMGVARMARLDHAWLRHILPLGVLLLLPGVEAYHLLVYEPPEMADRAGQQAVVRSLVQDLGISAPNAELPDNRWAAAHKLHYVYIEDLLKALRDDLPELDPLAAPGEKGPVLANFGVSGTVLTYTGLPIVLHPKFETPGIRQRVHDFYHHLYLEPEADFRDWAVRQGARYYLHRKGSFAGGDLRNSAPYMVDALDPPPDAAWRTLEEHPEQATWFMPLPLSNPLYRLYRIVHPEDVKMAQSFTLLARKHFVAGDLARARVWALRALSYHWKYPPALEVLSRVQNASTHEPLRDVQP